MNKVKIIVLALAALIGISRSAHAEVALLQPDDFVGFTFWLVSMACLATTVFLFPRTWFSCSRMESVNYCRRYSYWYSFHTFYVCEKHMGYNWRLPNNL